MAPLPTFALPDEERAREHAEMDRFFDMLEEEEDIEFARDAEREQQRAREEHERRKANAAKELERLRKAKEMQRRMGKALLGGLSEESPAIRVEPVVEPTVEKGSKAGKKVAFAEGTSEKTDLSSPGFRAVHAGQPMKFQVVERRPTKPPQAASLPLQAIEADSDDESAPASPVPADSDDGGAIHSDHESPLTSEHELSDDELVEDPVLEDEFDIDEAAHQREVALAYYEKRVTLGQNAARAMSAHTHEPHEGETPGDHEWDQPVCSRIACGRSLLIDSRRTSRSRQRSLTQLRSQHHASKHRVCTNPTIRLFLVLCPRLHSEDPSCLKVPV